jgi:hypothetical protein
MTRTGRAASDVLGEMWRAAATDHSAGVDHVVLAEIDAVGDELRAEGRWLAAGFLMNSAIYRAWGDGDRCELYARAALADLESAVSTAEPDSLERVAALNALAQQLGRSYLLEFDPVALGRTVREIHEELADQVVRLAETAPHQDSMLVFGFRLATDLVGGLELLPSEDEVDDAVITTNAERVLLSIPSAFSLFMRVGDYRAAGQIAERLPDAFRTPGLRGWREVARAYLRPSEAADAFDKAADYFAEDVYKEDTFSRTGSWSSVNVDLWSKYFRARARVAEVIEHPTRAIELLAAAKASLVGTDSGWVRAQVTCFRILVAGLYEILTGDPEVAAQRARAEFESWARIFGFNDEERTVADFLDAASAAFTEIGGSPDKAFVSGRLVDALRLLGRIPLIGDQVANAVQPAIGRRAHEHSLGPIRSWIYRALEGIRDEKVLQRLLLRLAQAALPGYAQIRHGPVEYGKDVVVLVEENQLHILRMYQAKVGDISKANWAEIEAQLEEMFLVPTIEAQLPTTPDDRIGILVLTGHLNPFIEPVVHAWVQEQQRAYGRRFEVMHIDDVVQWIASKNLWNEFREAALELGIERATPVQATNPL